MEEVVDAANVYADSYANYYAQFPELYQTIPQQYYQAAGVRPKRKQGVADLMTEMLGTDAAVSDWSKSPKYWYFNVSLLSYNNRSRY